MNSDYPTLAIPASLRLKIYVLFSLVGLAISGTTVGYSTANQPQPLWLRIAIAVFSFLSVAVGYTAASHTPNATVSNDGPVPANDPVAPTPPVVTNTVVVPPAAPTISPEGGFAALGFIGVILLLVGLLSIVGLFHLAFAISVVLLVIGLLLLLADWRGTRVP